MSSNDEVYSNTTQSSVQSESPTQESDTYRDEESNISGLSDLNIERNSPSPEIIEYPSDETVTVKFITCDNQIFAKAFKRFTTIKDIRVELANMFAIPMQHVSVKLTDQVLSDTTVLAKLGVAASSTIELKLNIAKPYALNRDRIYGHIPTVDVITVRISGVSFIVEIENHCQEKEWLGGYRHRVTNKHYHHASTQTLTDASLKVCHQTQTVILRDSSTNTLATKMIQTQPFPSIDDKLMTVGRYIEYKEVNNTSSIENDITLLENIECENEIRNSVALPLLKQTEDTCVVANYETVQEPSPEDASMLLELRSLRQKIKNWNIEENKKIQNLDECERRTQRIEILNRTRQFLTILDREKRKLMEEERYKKEKQQLERAGNPKMFVSKTGSRVFIDTVRSQCARELNELYTKYNDDTLPADVKIKTITDLCTFFSRSKNFQFSDHIVRLLQQELELLNHGITQVPSLKARIERFIFFFVKYITCEEKRSMCNKMEKINAELTQYRNILRKLQDDEMVTFRCFTSLPFRMSATEMWYLVHEIWNDSSALSESREMEQLRMTRWQKEMEWTPWNCILLTKCEIKAHFKIHEPETEYDKCFVSKIRNKHLQAKVSFNHLSTFDELFGSKRKQKKQKISNNTKHFIKIL